MTQTVVDISGYDSLEEMNEFHRLENADLVEQGITIRDSLYWAVSNRQIKEHEAWIALREKVKAASEKAAETGEKAEKVTDENLCGTCNELIPPTGKRGRPARYHEACRPEKPVAAPKPAGAENRCAGCDVVIPPTGKRGRPARKCDACKAVAG